jgi:DNA-binding GntR family transcriptional regulator
MALTCSASNQISSHKALSNTQIAGWLRARIAAGGLLPDVPLPSEKTLDDLFGATRETARRAA